MWPFSAIANSIRQRRRAIFRFWDGSRMRAIDPMLPFRTLAQHEKFDWDTTPALIDMGNFEAMGLTADAVRAAFGVEALNETGTRGLTESECSRLLVDFMDYMAVIKKKGDTLLSSAAPTDSPAAASAQDSSAADSATKTNSPSS
jgi:hypothetical protein